MFFRFRCICFTRVITARRAWIFGRLCTFVFVAVDAKNRVPAGRGRSRTKGAQKSSFGTHDPKLPVVCGATDRPFSRSHDRLFKVSHRDCTACVHFVDISLITKPIIFNIPCNPATSGVGENLVRSAIFRGILLSAIQHPLHCVGMPSVWLSLDLSPLRQPAFYL